MPYFDPRFHVYQGLIACTVFVLVSACRNQSQVGFSAADAGMSEIAEDAGPLDGRVPLDANTTIDPSCPMPWVTVVIQDADSARIARFRTGGERPERCPDLRANGELPSTTVDAEPLDPSTIIAVGPDGVFAIDVSTDRVRWSLSTNGINLVQAFVIRSEPPQMGVASLSDLTTSLYALTSDGSGAHGLPRPPVHHTVRQFSVASDPTSNNAFASTYNGIQRFDPAVGVVLRSEDQGQSLTGLHGSRGPGKPRLVGVNAHEQLRTMTLDETWEFHAYAGISICYGLREAAPDPSDANRVFLRCREEEAMYLLWYDTERAEGEIILGGENTEPGLVLAGLGVVE